MMHICYIQDLRRSLTCIIIKMTKTNDENKNLCANCNKCCVYVAIELDKPKSKDDFHNIMWYLLHENILVCIDHDNDWIVEFKTKCKALQDNDLCGVYETRPNVCREYTQDSCEKYGEGLPYKKVFTNREQLIKWVYKNTRIKNLF